MRFPGAGVGIGSVVVSGLLLGYIPTANAFLHRGVERDLRELRPVLRGSETEFQKLLSETMAGPRAALLLVPGIGLGLGAAMVGFDPGIRQTHSGLSALDPLIQATVGCAWRSAPRFISSQHFTAKDTGAA